MARSRATIVHPSRHGTLELGLGYILYPIQPRTGETQTPEFARIGQPRTASLSIWVSTGL